MAKAPQSSAAGLIIRQKEPTNLETPLDQVDSYLTPTELFYIRSHFPAPTLEPASYRLRIDPTARTTFPPGLRRPPMSAISTANFFCHVANAAYISCIWAGLGCSCLPPGELRRMKR